MHRWRAWLDAIWPEDGLGWMMFAVIVFGVTLCIVIIIDAIQWPQYAQEHHCQLTGETRTYTHFIHAGKVLVPQITTQDEWVCDGGEIRWR